MGLAAQGQEQTGILAARWDTWWLLRGYQTPLFNQPKAAGIRPVQQVFGAKAGSVVTLDEAFKPCSATLQQARGWKLAPKNNWGCFDCEAGDNLVYGIVKPEGVKQEEYLLK